MLFSIDELKGMKLQALDGEIGKCVDFLFDDEHWAVRYMDARAGNWLTGQRVLISPISLQLPDWEAGTLPVKLTREQIKDSPSLAEDQPVSREFERNFFKFYGYGYYWMGNAVWGAGVLPSELENLYMANTADDQGEDNHLRSMKEVTRYNVVSNDEKVGHLSGMLVDGNEWLIRYFVVDTGSWLSHERVVVPPDWMQDISWSDRSLTLRVRRDMVEAAPRFHDGAPVTSEAESRYRRYFGSVEI